MSSELQWGRHAQELAKSRPSESPVAERIGPLSVPDDAPDYVQVNFERFVGAASQRDEAQEYLRRHITPTNNLRMYFDESQPLELKPGIRNLMHPSNQQAFGRFILRLREERLELWQQACQARQDRNDLMQRYTDLLWGGQKGTDEFAAVEAQVTEATWADRAVFSHLFDILAPRVIAEGVDPLSACL